MEKGRIINISRFCTDDGPGIRTTVFLKGCPLSCSWCHNPESQNSFPEILYKAEACKHCGRCVATCANGCHRLENGNHTFQRAVCSHCGRCAIACPTGALEQIGQDVTVQEVLDIVTRDIPFYSDKGGVTISGGEPLSQPDFTAELLRKCQLSGIHTAVETSGFCSLHALEKIMPWCNLLLFDLKETDEKNHMQFTGVPLQPILENLRKIDAKGIPTLIRLPIIPGWNDRNEHFHQAKALASSLHHCVGLEVMPYHNLGAYKYTQLGRAYRCTQVTEPTKETIARWRHLVESAE